MVNELVASFVGNVDAAPSEIGLELRFDYLSIVQVSDRRSSTTLCLVGEIDSHVCGCLEEAILLVATDAVATVRVDMTGVRFCDHAGLEALARVNVTLRAQRQQLVVFGVQRQVMRLLKILELKGDLGVSVSNPGRTQVG